MNKKILLPLVVLLSLALIIIGVSVIVANNRKATSTSTLNSIDITINVLVPSVETKSYKVSNSEKAGNGLLAILENLDNSDQDFSIEFKEFAFGKMIIKVNNIEPNENQFWNIKINQKLAEVGVSQILVNDKDTIDLELSDLIVF